MSESCDGVEDLLKKTQTPGHVAGLFPKLLEGGHDRFSAFELLPREILVQICKELIGISLDDLYHLALASPAFFEPAWSTFVKEETWAGKRIVCIGDYACSYPPGMFTAKETRALNEDGLDDMYALPGRINMFEVSSKMPFEPYTPHIVGRRIFKFLPGRVKKPATHCSWDLAAAVVPVPHARILRNHTFKEYVGLECIYEAIELSSWVLIIVQTAWSDNPWTSTGCDDELLQGPWAGNRIDITSTDDVDETWTDATEDIIKKFRGWEEW
ncbi:hypothetical protein GGF46_004604 [Coemansia sp. RSA 552]|nr:hypothetical protein GGF46_004604 [Coemansia sp. RSA 552]